MRGRATRREDLEQAVLYCNGSVNRIAIALGVSTNTVYDQLNRHPDIKELFQDMKDYNKDEGRHDT